MQLKSYVTSNKDSIHSSDSSPYSTIEVYFGSKNFKKNIVLLDLRAFIYFINKDFVKKLRNIFNKENHIYVYRNHKNSFVIFWRHYS